MAFLSNKQCQKRGLKTGYGFQFEKVAQFQKVALKFKWDMLNLGWPVAWLAGSSPMALSKIPKSPVSKNMVSANSAESHAGIFIKLKYWFPLSQLEHNNDQIRVKTKQLAWKMTAQPYNRFVFMLWL